MRNLSVLMVAVLLVAVMTPATVFSQYPPYPQYTQYGRPNIIVIMSDDMGYSDLGCYGGEIPTPNLDKLAAGGVRFTQFYNTARCCPTRASLLTGLHPHQAEIGHMMENRNLPGYRGNLGRNCATIAEVLRTAGYRNYCVGKWHVTPFNPGDNNEPNKDNWPLQRGFDRYYGTIDGAGNFFDPTSLCRDNTVISPFADPEYKKSPDEYYYTDALSDNAAKFVREHHKQQTGAPFFMYVAYTAAHWPIQAPAKEVAKYKGLYDTGYEPVRLARFAKMKEIGLLPESSELSPLVGNWNEVKNKPWEAACMEVYTAMVNVMDQGIGRIVDSLKETNSLDNTVIFYLQDNGACAETMGRTARKDYTARVEKPIFEPIAPETIVWKRAVVTSRTREGFPVLEGESALPGPKDTNMAYGRNWANVSNTPFREYKHWVHEGGISTPLVVHAPNLIPSKFKGAYQREPGQLVDLMSTCVDLASATYPKQLQGKDIIPMEGASLVPLLTEKQFTRTRPLVWEHEGNRAIRDGKWKLVAKGQNGAWELYNMETDRSELHDLAGTHSELVTSLSQAWDDWAVRANVKPWPWK